jgi:hypothetical protein
MGLPRAPSRAIGINCARCGLATLPTESAAALTNPWHPLRPSVQRRTTAQLPFAIGRKIAAAIVALLLRGLRPKDLWRDLAQDVSRILRLGWNGEASDCRW